MPEQPAEEPYLAPGRLPKLIAAIQAMATLGWGSQPIDKWVQELEGAEQLALGKTDQDEVKDHDRKTWREIFAQHPEFFKLYKLDKDERVALRWRFAQSIDYDPHTGKVLSSEELASMPRDKAFYAQYTRRPLAADQVDVLIKTAIDLHSRVLAAQQENRWHWPIIVAIVVASLSLIGVVVNAYLKGS
jgi:hypothetical protein